MTGHWNFLGQVDFYKNHAAYFHGATLHGFYQWRNISQFLIYFFDFLFNFFYTYGFYHAVIFGFPCAFMSVWLGFLFVS
jgi:hypothetical protein